MLEAIVLVIYRLGLHGLNLRVQVDDHGRGCVVFHHGIASTLHDLLEIGVRLFQGVAMIGKGVLELLISRANASRSVKSSAVLSALKERWLGSIRFWNSVVSEPSDHLAAAPSRRGCVPSSLR